MDYKSDNRLRSDYNSDKFSTSNRDNYDDALKQREKNFIERHRSQLLNARLAEKNDNKWVASRGRIQTLNENIKLRKANYDTYTHSMNIEKTLYNRERHRTLLLGITNAAAIAGCIAMWWP
tara:strand:- start:636 stop:998 length:363 start_codon:yes stop_codon:yes gene_type:complete